MLSTIYSILHMSKYWNGSNTYNYNVQILMVTVSSSAQLYLVCRFLYACSAVLFLPFFCFFLFFSFPHHLTFRFLLVFSLTLSFPLSFSFSFSLSLPFSIPVTPFYQLPWNDTCMIQIGFTTVWFVTKKWLYSSSTLLKSLKLRK